MDNPIVLGSLALMVMLLLASVGIPIGFALAGVAAVGIWFVGGFNFLSTTLQTMPFEFINNYTFVALPMFVLMGLFAQSTGVVTELYRAAYIWTSGIRGGLYHATTLASAGFAAISGSTMVNSALFTKIALPEMARYKYNLSLGAGIVAATGVLAALIPPSLSFIIYAFLTGESIGQLLISGILPGLLTAGIFLIGTHVIVSIKPEWAPKLKQKVRRVERLNSLINLWPAILLVTIVLGGMYTGLMTPSAAGAVGAIGVLVISLARRKMKASEFKNSLQETIVTTAVLTMILLGGILFARFLTLAGFLDELLGFVQKIGMNRLSLIIFVSIFFLFLGGFMDTLSIWVISVPVLHPIALALDINPLWFAVFIVKLSEIGCMSPPVGLNLFAVLGSSGGKITAPQIYKGVIPYIIMEIITLIILYAFPAIVTWLPSQMIN